MNKTNEIIQWVGALFIILGHSLNAVGPAADPWNVVAFFLGTVAFLTWTLRVKNRPQMTVNLVALVLTVSGLIRAFFG